MIAAAQFLLGLLELVAVAGAAAGDATIVIEQGAIRGKVVSIERIGGTDESTPAVRAWLGIPFAAPPVGPLRWRPPQPPAPWQDVRACDAFGPSCPQPTSPMSVLGGGAGEQSEDCLYLNVWAPAPRQVVSFGGAGAAARPASQLPVMVWIHGGGFFMGAGSGRAYDGANLARKGAVVVTLNYRLGPFGFLGHPELTKESPEGSSGNYGLLDQIAALRWVQKNAAAFGGDPGNVTIFGESAGAFSVGCLLISPLAKGLFHRAISESGAAIWITRRLKERGLLEEPFEAVGERVIAKLIGDEAATTGGDGKSAIAAARAKSASELLLVAQPVLRLLGSGEGNVFGPVVDGYVVPDDPWRLFEAAAAGQANHVNLVPLLIGTNADEGTMFTLQGPPVTAELHEGAIRRLYGDAAPEVLAWYSPERFGDLTRARTEMITDSIFVAPTRAQTRAWAKAGAPCFLYEFTRVGGRLGAFHASEIAYVFGHLEDGLLARYDATDRELSATVMDYWLQFARTGDPNRPAPEDPEHRNLPAWPEYAADEDRHLELGTTIQVGSELRARQCDLWDQIFARWQAKARASR